MCFYLAPFEINITAHNIQLVSYPLILDCSIKEIVVTNSPLEIVWTTNTTTLQRTNVMPNGSSVYTDSYTITQLTTSDQGRVIQCIANRTTPPVMDNGNITLNVTGKLNGSKFYNKSMQSTHIHDFCDLKHGFIKLSIRLNSNCLLLCAR